MREITGVVRDDAGFVWAASRTGVLRVTANDSRLYELPFTTTDVMQVKIACRHNELVAASQNGQVFRYNRVHDRFERWFTLAALLGNEGWVTNLLIDTDGKVWISTSVGVFTWTGEEAVPAFRGRRAMLTLPLWTVAGCWHLCSRPSTASIRAPAYLPNARESFRI